MKRYLSLYAFVFLLATFYFSCAHKANAAITLLHQSVPDAFVATTAMSSTGSGNVLLLIATDVSGNVSSVVDNAPGGSNTYGEVTGAMCSLAAGGTYHNHLFIVSSSKSGATSLTVNGTSIGGGLFFMEYSGVSTSSPVDSSAHRDNAPTVANVDVGATTTVTNASDTIIVFGNPINSISAVAAPWGHFYENDAGEAIADYQPGAIGNYSASFTDSGGSTYCSDGVALKPPSLAIPGNTTGYAWGEKMGWINFGTTFGTLKVMTTTITGYAWSQNFGWINMAPASSGVMNDGNGNLSGDAWSQGTGYIDFDNVSIDANGVFHGTASGSISGRIRFDSSTGCTYCNVSTTWTPTPTTPLSISSVNINSTNPATITLTTNATTTVNVEATVTDNSCSQITGGTTTILLYRSGVTSSSCLTGSGNGVSTNLNCYIATAFTASSTCSGGTQNTTTTFGVQYFAQATDSSSSFPNQNWIATVIVKDSGNATSSGDSTHSISSNDMATLVGFNVTTSSINYGLLAASSTSGAVNQTTTLQNTGNASTTFQLFAAATLTNGSRSIATSSQGYSTSTFTYPGTSTAITASAVTVSGFLLTSPTSTTNVQSTIFWGISVPNGTPTGTYAGTNQFTAVFNP